jgi:transcription initiation factor IIE alpha subunit
MQVFREIYPEDWKLLVDKFELLDNKRRYTVSTHLSNRLGVYSRKTCSLLTRYEEGKFNDYRKTTVEERGVFGSPWIAVFKKRPENLMR